MPSPPPAPAAPKPPHDKLSAPARALRKLGLARDIDLALHLPMRYVDETCLTPIGSLRDGDTAQVQGTVVECRVETRTRRQLVVRPVSYTHLRAHETVLDLVCRLLLEKKTHR